MRGPTADPLPRPTPTLSRPPDWRTLVSEHPRPEKDAAPAHSRRSLRRLGVVAVAVAIAAAAVGILQRRGHEAAVAEWTTGRAIPTVAIIAPAHNGAGGKVTLPGNIQAWYEAPIYARVNGYLKNWDFDYGAHVKKGEVLAEIDAPDLDAQLAAARSKLNSAKALVKVREAERQFAETTYMRWRDSPKGVVSVQEQEEKEADYSSAVAQLTAAEAQVNADQGDVDRLRALESFKKIVAPFDGIVTARETDIGALINAGSGTRNGPELFRVADIHKMRIYVQVPQQMSAGIQSGLTAEMHLPQYPDRIFKAIVVTTSGAINMNSRTLLAELNTDNPEGLLQPGAYAEVEFDLPGNPQGMRIPTSALLFREHGLKVATVGPDGKVELKAVTLGRNLGTNVEVLSGLAASDHVVNSPPDSLAAGDSVHVAGPSGPVNKDLARAAEQNKIHRAMAP
jgi:RND family efflux transporter MFP subunit